MNRIPGRWYLSILIVLALVLVGCQSATVVEVPPPPMTQVEMVTDTLHGVAIEDPYRWLEDQNSPQTREWITAQNDYTTGVMQALPGREKVTNRLNELLRVDHIGTPNERNGRYFLQKEGADDDLYIIYMRQGLNGPDEALVDPHPMSEDHSISVNITDISKDGSMLVYSVRRGGVDETSVHCLDVDSRQLLADSLPEALYFGVSITPDKKSLYYSKGTEQGPRVYHHAMGTDFSKDKLIFGEGRGVDEFISASVSEDGRYLLIGLYYGSAGTKNDLYFKDVTKDGPIKTLVNDINAKFSGAAVGDQIFLKTDWKAPNGRIMVADLTKPAPKNWKEVIPTSDLVMENFILAGGKLCVGYLDSVKSKVSVFDADGVYQRDISFPNIGSVGKVRGRWGSNEAFYTFTSFNSPKTIYRYDVASGESSVWVGPNVTVDADNIEIKQVWYTSRDGTKVPMFLTHRKGLKLDGNNPVVLTGYGGFGASLTPYFSSMVLTWIENGGVWAIANLRGGGEFGKPWHEAAKFEKKQNSFDDFIAAAEYLIETGYTQSSKLAIRGGSNGGLLVGAILTQRPELVKAVICTYPLLDMLRYHKFLMGPYWVSEYGSADVAEQFEYIYAYSPYHRVKPGTLYPSVLFITGDADTRVDPNHARKMTALLQASTGSDNPVMLRYEIKAGHSGGRPMSQIVDDASDELCYLFWQLGHDIE